MYDIDMPAWNASCLLEHIDLVWIVLLASIIDGFDKWNYIGFFIHFWPVHRHSASSIGKVWQEFVVFIAHDVTFQLRVKTLVPYGSDMR